ncbi:MAG: fatty acid--CoA ligase family protein [Bacteroides intestinalis]|nr:fatty acid--CoA ligase family protein [Bacteroides intestinalis]
MKPFLIDNDKVYTYQDLLDAIQTDGFYYPYYKVHDVFLYFVNLVKALANNQSLVLLDSDLNSSEIENLDESLVNQPQIINTSSFSDIPEVINAVKKSVAEITIFTSGTTGQPKKVLHSISSLTRSVRTGERYANQIWGYAYAPTHMAGLQVFFQAFENENTLVNIFGRSRNEVYRCISNHHITHISATPTFYRLLLPSEKEYDTVIRVTLGGEKSDERLYDSMRCVFPNAKINNVYASTEAGSLFAAKGDCFQIPEAIRDKFGVEDDELLIHKSLLGRSDSFKFEGDYYHSGDLIEWIDKSMGLFKFKSRKNELINVGGYKVNPGEVENVLLSIDGIQQVLVYGKANSVLGNILCADIQLEPNIELTEIDIKKILRSNLQDFKIPRRFRFVEAMTLTRTGKLKRQ